MQWNKDEIQERMSELTQKLSSLDIKKLEIKKGYLIGAGAVLGGFFALKLFLPLFVDTDAIKTKLVTTLEKEADVTAEIRGDVSVSLFPFAYISVEDVAFSKEGMRIGTTDKLEIEFSLLDAFGDTVQPDTITFVNPEIKEKLSINPSQSFASLGAVVIENGTYNGLTKINLEADMLVRRAEGTFVYHEQPVSFHFNSPTENNVRLRVKHPMVSVSLNGDYKLYKGNLSFTGKAKTEFHNLKGFLDIAFEDCQLLNQYNLPNTLSLSGDVAYYRGRLLFKKFHGSFGESRVAMSLDYPLKEQAMSPIAFSLGIDELNLDTIANNRNGDESSFLKLQDVTIPKHLFISTDFSIEKLIYNKRSITINKLRADVMDGDVVLQPSVVQLPGDNTLTLFGVFGSGSTVDWDKEGTRRFAGEVELSGKNLKELLLLSGLEPVANLPEDSLKSFSLSGDIFITSDEFRLADIEAEFDDATLDGVVIASTNGETKINATVQVDNVTLDKYLPTKFRLLAPNEEERAQGFVDAFRWIESVDFKLKMDSRIINSRFKEQTIDRIDFTALADKNTVRLNDIRLTSSTLKVTGNFGVTTQDGLPNITTNLVFGALNTSDIWEKPTLFRAPLISEETWSKDPFDFSALSKFNSEFNLEFYSLKHEDYLFDNLKLSGTVQNRVLNIKEITGETWNGRVAGAITLAIQNVPSVSMSFKLHNIDMQPLVKSLFGLDNMTGRGGVNGKLQTSGMTPYSWMHQLSGRVSIVSRPFILTGFSLPSIEQKISRLRTVADIINISRLAFQGGQTYFEKLSGTASITNGQLFTPLPIELDAKVVNGNAAVKLNLVDSEADILSQFSLNVMSCDLPAVLKIRQAGKLQTMKKVLDTKLLEDYVAKCSATRMLNR